MSTHPLPKMVPKPASIPRFVPKDFSQAQKLPQNNEDEYKSHNMGLYSLYFAGDPQSTRPVAQNSDDDGVSPDEIASILSSTTPSRYSAELLVKSPPQTPNDTIYDDDDPVEAFIKSQQDDDINDDNLHKRGKKPNKPNKISDSERSSYLFNQQHVSLSSSDQGPDDDTLSDKVQLTNDMESMTNTLRGHVTDIQREVGKRKPLLELIDKAMDATTINVLDSNDRLGKIVGGAWWDMFSHMFMFIVVCIVFSVTWSIMLVLPKAKWF